MRPRKKLSPEQRALLAKMARGGASAAEIHKALDGAIGRSTVARRVREVLGTRRARKRPTKKRSRKKSPPASPQLDPAEQARQLEQARQNPITLDEIVAELAVVSEQARSEGAFAVYARIVQLQLAAKLAAERIKAAAPPEGIFLSDEELRATAERARDKLLAGVAAARVQARAKGVCAGCGRPLTQVDG
jgi:transposase